MTIWPRNKRKTPSQVYPFYRLILRFNGTSAVIINRIVLYLCASAKPVFAQGKAWLFIVFSTKTTVFLIFIDINFPFPNLEYP